jgi:ribonuclease PH
LRPVSFELGVARALSARSLIMMGNTGVMIEETVPRWMKKQNVSGGWLTAEYSMLPYSTQQRRSRDIAKGRLEITG